LRKLRIHVCFLLAGLTVPIIAACATRMPDEGVVGTAVAGTLAALPMPTPQPTAYPTKAIFTASYSILLDPGVSGTMTYADALGFTTTLDFPGETASTPTTVTLIPELATDPPTGASPAAHAFVVLVLPGGQLSKGFVFPLPVQVTITHEGAFLLGDDELRFLWWSGEDWTDPAQSCNPPKTTSLDLEQNALRSWMCYPGAFGLFSMSDT